MANTYSQLHIHLIFAVANRANLIDDKWKNELYNYMVGIINRQGCRSIIINGTNNHVHLLIELHPDKTISELVKAVKSFSSKWVNENKLSPGKFHWQGGYGAFSHSHSSVSKVINYINNQEQHHKNMTFLNEYKRFLELYQIEYDERYLFNQT